VPSRPSVEVEPPTPGELAELVAATPDQYAALVVLLDGTGLRISEALGLQVGDASFLGRKLQVSRQRDPRTNLLAPTKTRSSVRSVPLGQVVVDVLAAHLATYPPAEDGSIFTDDRGRPLTYERWKPIWKATGATFKTHDLHHYAASALIAGGASVKRVRRSSVTPPRRSRWGSTATCGRTTTTAPGRFSTRLLRTVCGFGRWSDDMSAGQRPTTLGSPRTC
jgi:integrase